jgi:hypothetical protein
MSFLLLIPAGMLALVPLSLLLRWDDMKRAGFSKPTLVTSVLLSISALICAVHTTYIVFKGAF